jgi:hypothetical protein
LHHLDHGIEAELKHKVVLSTEDKLLGLPGNLALSSAQTDTYFGTEGRSRFFERSKWAHRQRQNTNVNSKEPVKKLYSNFSSTSLSKEIAFNPPDRIVKRMTSASASIVGVPSDGFQRQLKRFNNRSDGDVDVDVDAAVKINYLKEVSNSDVGSLDAHYDADDVLETLQDNDEDEDDLDDLSLMTMLLESGQEITEAPSPRTNFIMSCIREQKNPMASLIVRKKLSKIMNLNHYGLEMIWLS